MFWLTTGNFRSTCKLGQLKHCRPMQCVILQSSIASSSNCFTFFSWNCRCWLEFHTLKNFPIFSLLLHVHTYTECNENFTLTIWMHFSACKGNFCNPNEKGEQFYSKNIIPYMVQSHVVVTQPWPKFKAFLSVWYKWVFLFVKNMSSYEVH